MHYSRNPLLIFFILYQLTTEAKAQTVVLPVRNITASGGDDILLECRHTSDPIIVSWRKEGMVVEASDTYRDGRIYMAENEGMLILNAELWDRGLYSCMIVLEDRVITHQIWLDVAPPTDTDVHSNSAFQCGYPRVRGKIVGGKVSNEGQSPWTALLWKIIQDKPFCGGVLLNRRWVVTAAHCFSHSGLSKDEFEVRLGEHDTQTVDSYERTFRAEQIIKHPNFNEETYDSDIALIKLQQPVTYTDYIIPLCLPSELRAEELLQGGQRGFVTGWGNTEEHGDYSRFLRKVRLTISSQQECGNRHSDIITNNMFCADAGRKSVRRDACHGDSGGPFVTKDNNRWYLLGIVSWGIGCARPEYPGVYTRVHRFRQWIMDLVQQDMQTCEESSFELGEDLRASRKEANNLRMLNQEQQRQIEELQDDLMNKEREIYALQERIQEGNCETDAAQTTPRPPETLTSKPTTIPVVTEARPLTTRVPIQEVAMPCRHNMCWHVSVQATCHGGVCVCDSPDHSPISCLPIVGSCHVYRNNSYALAQASFRGDMRREETYSCEGTPNSNVHIIAVYEGPVHTRPPTAGEISIRVTGGNQGPLTLVFSSYEPVRWRVTIDPGITVNKFVLTAYYLDLSSIELVSSTHPNVTVVRVSRVPLGYGSDGGGSHTAEFLKFIQNAYGDIGSFTGTYRADNWVLSVPGNTPLTEPIRLPLPMARLDSSASHVSWTPYEFRYDSSVCACHGKQYVKSLQGSIQMDYGVNYVGVILCQTPQRYKIFLANDPSDKFLNIGDSHGSGHDHCELVGARPENQTSTLTANDWYNLPAVMGFYRGVWGERFSAGTIGGGFYDWTGRIIVSWYDCGVEIP